MHESAELANQANAETGNSIGRDGVYEPAIEPNFLQWVPRKFVMAVAISTGLS